MSQLRSWAGSPLAQKILDEIKNPAHNAQVRKMHMDGVSLASIQQHYSLVHETTRKALYSEKAIRMVCEGIQSIDRVSLTPMNSSFELLEQNISQDSESGRKSAPVALQGEYRNDSLGKAELRDCGQRGGRLASWRGGGWQDGGESVGRPRRWNSWGMPGCTEQQARPYLQDGRFCREYPQGGLPQGASDFRGGGIARIQNGEAAGRQSCALEVPGHVQLGGGRVPVDRQWDGSCQWKSAGGIVTGMERRPSDGMVRMREGGRDQCEARNYGEILFDRQV
jgi:hypothetical protein